MKTKHEIAEERIDSMKFNRHEKGVIFYGWQEGDEHLDWLLTATNEEIVSWLKVVDTEE